LTFRENFAIFKTLSCLGCSESRFVPTLPMEITFEVIQETEGSYVAACYSENIYTEGSSLEELHDNITSAIDIRFRGRTKPSPSAVRLMVFRE